MAQRTPGVRAAIQHQALHRFVAQGYSDTSLDEIADACHMSRPAVLYHFGTKEALLLSIVEPALCAVREVLESFRVQDDPSPRQQELVLRALIGVDIDHRAAVGLLTRLSPDVTTANLGDELRELTQRAGRLIGGRAFDDDMPQRLLVMGCLMAVAGLMAPRLEVDLDGEQQVETLVSGLMRLLNTPTP